LKQKPFTSYNPYFFIPFILWVIGGGIALMTYDNRILFEAVNGRHTPTADVLMQYTTYMGEGALSAVLLLVLLGMASLRNWWYFTAAVLTNVIPPFIIQMVKRSVDAPRPLKYFNEAPWIHTLPQWDRLMEHSFPSGHTCAAFCLFSFLAILLKPGYRWIGVLLFALALLVGYSRLYLAAHFFADAYAGSIIGTIFTVLVITLLNRYKGYFLKSNT